MAHLSYFGFLVCQIILLLQKQYWHKVQVYCVYYNLWDAFTFFVAVVFLIKGHTDDEEKGEALKRSPSYFNVNKKE